MAYYNAVIRQVRPETVGKWSFNNLWDLRPMRMYDSPGKGACNVINIDHETFVKADYPDFVKYQAGEWFIDPKTGFVTHIMGYCQETKEFSYTTLHEQIFGGPCEHLNGLVLDCRRNNLILPGTKPPFSVTIMGENPLEDLKVSERRPNELLFGRRLLAWLRYKKARAAGEPWTEEQPDDPWLHNTEYHDWMALIIKEDFEWLLADPVWRSRCKPFL